MSPRSPLTASPDGDSIAVIEGDPDRAILEVRLRGATAVAFQPPAHAPAPWPRSATSWVADLPVADLPNLDA